jgi:hypothetical protein
VESPIGRERPETAMVQEASPQCELLIALINIARLSYSRRQP